MLRYHSRRLEWFRGSAARASSAGGKNYRFAERSGERAHKANRAAERVKQEFGLKTIIARYAALYGELLRGSTRNQSQTRNASQSGAAAIQGSS
jgi:hypothetical protein